MFAIIIVMVILISIGWPVAVAHVCATCVHVVRLLSSIKHDTLRQNIVWTFASTQVLQSVL